MAKFARGIIKLSKPTELIVRKPAPFDLFNKDLVQKDVDIATRLLDGAQDLTFSCTDDVIKMSPNGLQYKKMKIKIASDKVDTSIENRDFVTLISRFLVEMSKFGYTIM